MKAFQERVVLEQKELDEKRAKLAVFLKGRTIKTLPLAEGERLHAQAEAMMHYSVILGERIMAFEKEAANV